jgi:glycine hydroxymethyltransferase
MGEGEMREIAVLLAEVLRGGIEPARARAQVRELAGGFPPYPH